MRQKQIFSNEYAVTEVVGALLLMVVAVSVAGAIYFEVLPIDLPPAEPNVHLTGYVTEDGAVILEHMGGEAIGSYEIYIDGNLTYKSEEDPWTIGERYTPALQESLHDEEDQVTLLVIAIYDDGSKAIIFDGVLSGADKIEGLVIPPSLISTLRTNTIDEDLICYNKTLVPDIDPLTNIYNWVVNTGGGDKSITQVLMPFDTDTPYIAKDYSGNNNDGIINKAIWSASGQIGGSYNFDGDDNISLPYSFDSVTVDELTIEAWIKTEALTGTIASFNRNTYWGLELNDGNLQWTTSTSNGTSETAGSTPVNDGVWHHIAATYDASTGSSVIAVDGQIDIQETAHDMDEELGDGSMPAGFIGREAGDPDEETIFATSFETQGEKNQWNEHNKTGEEEEQQTDQLHYDDFNDGWTEYQGGGNSYFLSSSYKHEGQYAAGLRRDGYIYLRDGIDVHSPAYTTITVDFWWMWRDDDHQYGWKTWEHWMVKYYDGNGWRTVNDLSYPSGYEKDVWYHMIVYINESEYTFPSNMKIAFQIDGGSNYDQVYIDQVHINATSTTRVDYDFDLRTSDELDPHTGDYSIGGTGDFDPDVAAFNRTGIDISQFENINVSVWYSYKNTESVDFFGFYYLHGEDWIPIFQINEPEQSSGQYPWTQKQAQIPDEIDNLILQFKWTTSSSSEWMAIDDLEITGTPKAGGGNFTGWIDEFRIYNRALSEEQLYQNYLNTNDGSCNKSVLVSEETMFGDIWKCIITPNNGFLDGTPIESNTILVSMYPGGEE